MAKVLNSGSDNWLLPELRLDDLFLSDDKRHLPPPELHSNDDDSAFSRRMTHSFLHKDEDFNSLLIMQNQNSSASSKLPGDEFYPNPYFTQHKLQVARFHYLKQQQLLKNQVSVARRTQSIAKGPRPLGFFSSSSSPPAFKSQPGSGMRAVFLNPRKESSGTGVFLPRQPGSPNEPRKRPACSSALLPARVDQALNLNLEKLWFYQRAPSHGMGLVGNQKRSSSRNRSPWASGAADRLPPEWTYT